ncbi:hypothetical protein KFZ58_13055 [Virgibacillus sp. NKC19-16]|uniref:hypothetical protein n=1 Tax=Virgibacillus salidurans TaxID=2831673 RepID=UPI001F32FCAF|nr:hypothetical protein [Virgibacillus sp. NKC19-16]UJL45333.1 hypothetical protein KFZ58_13055 [Virgibacillus sp. NKC19-16]
MKEQERIAFNELIKKVQQHEDTITQLVKIVAATNRRITDTADKHKSWEHALHK